MDKTTAKINFTEYEFLELFVAVLKDTLFVPIIDRVAAIREARKNSTQKEAPVRKRKRKRKSPSWDDLLKEIQNGKN